MDQYSSTGSSAKGSSFGGRPPSVQDSEKQLQLGIKYIMEAFENKNAGLVIEVARWKQIASDGNRKVSDLLVVYYWNDTGTKGSLTTIARNQSHRFQLRMKQITSLEAQINALTHHVERLGRALSAETEEKESMTASHNALLEKYTSLKKEAVKLEHFRKSIVSMIEYSSTSRVRNILDQSFNLNSDLDFQEALARAGEEFGGSLRVITEKKGEPSEDGEDERAVDDEVDEEEDEQAREDGEEEDAAHEQNDDVEELDLDADSAANGDEDEDGEEDEEMATLEQFESTDGGTPDLEVYYTLNRPRASSTSLNPIAPAVSFGMHRNPSDLALLTKQSPSKQLQSPPQGQSATPQSASQRVLTHRNSIDAMGGSFTPTGSGRVRQIIAENKAKSEPQQKRWSLQDAARLAPAVGGGSVDTNNNNQRGGGGHNARR
ncbi:hypothetical protein BC938DRAFT_480629 [Jimgerdemannia flammicorona]|uniref:Uncharacterized protein n=1 Tax=Jimgerdemannia flammicorona TaxID=994334 RepID=A0A433QI33_9FUNG|nr:hypothetical protein BC938DRAFT_480629 [Jimgerdemannia flammicorona]